MLSIFYFILYRFIQPPLNIQLSFRLIGDTCFRVLWFLGMENQLTFQLQLIVLLIFFLSQWNNLLDLALQYKISFLSDVDILAVLGRLPFQGWIRSLNSNPARDSEVRADNPSVKDFLQESGPYELLCSLQPYIAKFSLFALCFSYNLFIARCILFFNFLQNPFYSSPFSSFYIFFLTFSKGLTYNQSTEQIT